MNFAKDTLGNLTMNLDRRRIPLNSKQRSEKKVKGLYPYFGANNILDYIDEFIFDEKILCIAEDGGSWGGQEKCAYIVNEKCWVNNHAHVLKANGKAHLDYLYFFLNHHNLNKYITGTTRGKLTRRELEKIVIPLPAIEDQKRIAKVLSDCEALIKKRKESIVLLDELLKSTFLEMFGDEQKFESKPVEEIASEERYALSSGPFGSNLTSKDYTPDGVIILRGTNISSGELNLTKIKYVSEEKAQELKRSELKPDDVVIVAVGSSGTALKIPKSLPRAIMSQNFNKITPNQELVLPIYLEYSINSEIVQRQFRKATTNAGRSFLGLTKIKEVKIPVPPIDEQLKFYEIIDKVSAIKQQFNSSLKELENLYGSLSQRAFKGELDLSKVDISDMEDSTQEKPEMEPVGDPRWEGKVEVQDYQVHLDEIIKKDFENSSFSFKQLEDAISERGVYVPYDNVKDFVFKSLEGNESLLVQEIDEKDKLIVFKIRS
jgi:type I restriction enzyme S subunit